MGLQNDRRMFLGLLAGALALPFPAAAQMRDLVQGGRSGASSGNSGGASLGGGAPAPQGATGPEPAAIVRQIFDSYRAGTEPSPPWSPAIRTRMRRTRIEADPILDAQDIEVKQFTVHQISRDHDRASVEVRFLSFGRNMRSVFDFRTVDGRWVIGNYRILAGSSSTSDIRQSLGLPPLK